MLLVTLQLHSQQVLGQALPDVLLLKKLFIEHFCQHCGKQCQDAVSHLLLRSTLKEVLFSPAFYRRLTGDWTAGQGSQDPVSA